MEENGKSGVHPGTAKKTGEVLPNNPGVRFVPSAATIAAALQKEGGDGDEENTDDFRSISH